MANLYKKVLELRNRIVSVHDNQDLQKRFKQQNDSVHSFQDKVKNELLPMLQTEAFKTVAGFEDARLPAETINEAVKAAKNAQTSANMALNMSDFKPINSSISEIDKLWKKAAADWKQIVGEVLKPLTSKAQTMANGRTFNGSDVVIAFLKSSVDFADLSKASSVFETFLKLCQEARPIIEEYSIPSDVANFLTRVKCGTATLADLTQSIMQWLNGHGQASLIRLSYEGTIAIRQ